MGLWIIAKLTAWLDNGFLSARWYGEGLKDFLV
jgi:hypothetical protein